jgi:hypothetical protein
VTVSELPVANYEHKQTSPLNLILYALGVVQLAAAWVSRSNPAASIILSFCAVVMILAGLCVGYLIVRDEGDFLALRFGPLPIFRRLIAFSKITAVEPSRSTVLDGWGIHYIPGRGMTYNVWGFDCVRMSVDSRTIRVGTDDVQGLVRFLKEKVTGQGTT